MQSRPGMKTFTRIAVAAAVVFVAIACSEEAAPEVKTIDQFTLASLGQGDLRATGMARDSRTGNMWLLSPGVGLIEVSPKGQLVSQIRFGEKGLAENAFNDVTMLADGKFALTANGEGYLYDPKAERLEFFFCLVPSFEPIEMVNDAITYDEASGRIFVAPVYYDTSSGERRLIRALLAQYAGADGAALVENDVMAAGVVAKGLAFDPATRGVWALEGSRLTYFSADGKTDGRVLELAGIENGAGVTFDGDRMWVLDAADNELRSFPRP